jgi:mannose-6-phosphate isomerase-like protein (cupin superfamily)
MDVLGIAACRRGDVAIPEGYARDCPFGCVDQGLYSVIYFRPGQAMRPHRHLDSDEYFTALQGDAEMYVNGRLVPLDEGQTFLRRRGVLHAIRNPGPDMLIIQSFQSPIPAEDMTRWESVPDWGPQPPFACPRCWCGQIEDSRCENCNAPVKSRKEAV